MADDHRETYIALQAQAQSSLVDDILALLNQRRTALQGEMARIDEIQQAVQPGTAAPAAAIAVAHDAPARTRSLRSDASRQRQSRKMKAVWRKRRRSAKA